MQNPVFFEKTEILFYTVSPQVFYYYYDHYYYIHRKKNGFRTKCGGFSILFPFAFVVVKDAKGKTDITTKYKSFDVTLLYLFRIGLD